MHDPTLDTSNTFCVGTQGDEIVVLLPVPRHLTQAQALSLAAWLVALADTDNQFPALLDAIHNT